MALARYSVVAPNKSVRSLHLYTEEIVNGELVGKNTEVKMKDGGAIFEVDDRYEWVYNPRKKKDGPAFTIVGGCKNGSIIVLVPQLIT